MFILSDNSILPNWKQITLYKYLLKKQYLLNFLINTLQQSYQSYFCVLTNFKITKIVWFGLNYHFNTIIANSSNAVLKFQTCGVYKTTFVSPFKQLNYKLNIFTVRVNKSNLNKINKILSKQTALILIYNTINYFINSNSVYFNFFYMCSCHLKLKSFNFTRKFEAFRLKLNYNLRINNAIHLTRYNWTLI